MINFQFYPAKVRSNQPEGFVTLKQFIKITKNPSPEIKQVFEKIRTADKQEKDRLKQSKLHYFTPTVIVNDYRRYANIKEFTGLAPVDFDGLTKEDAPDFRDALFNEYPQIWCAWLSASGKGVRALFNIPKANNVQEYKEYFFGIASDLAAYHGFDPAPQNAVLPLFQSWDDKLLSREDPEIWDKKGDVKRSATIRKYTSGSVSIGEIPADELEVYRRIYNAMANIPSENGGGHYPLRAISYAVGGYIKNGYIDEDKALQTFNSLITNHHYLGQKPYVYKQTVSDMFKLGKEKGLSL